MATWILKTEPSEYSFADLVKEGWAVWSGISNPVALKHLREVEKGDTLLIYHTANERRVVGHARAKSGPYPDPALGNPKRVVIDVTAGKPLRTPVSLEQFKADAMLSKTDLVRLGRLSVVPLSDAQYARVLKLAGE
jgi:predicted RNA-binding protein with PUA-like domain